MIINQNLRQRFFNLVHTHNLVYNQCWEDPRLDREALKINSNDNLLVLTSAGCNVLNYLLDDPQHIDAVDMNPRQNALLELKIAGIKNLEHPDFFQLFGLGHHQGIDKLYRKTLRPELPDFARGYWDRHIDFFKVDTLNPGFYFRGTAGTVARLLGQYLDWRGLFPWVQKAFAAHHLQEQQEIYYGQLKPVFWNGFLRWVTRRGLTMTALGVPRSQFEQIEKFYRGGMAQFIEDGLDAVFAKLSLKDNYFYHLYLFGSYSPQCAPDYLLPENFNRLRERVDRVETHNGSVLSFLQKTTRPLHKVTLLDHMDWLYQNHQRVLQEQWDQLLGLVTEGGRIIWRSASLRADFLDPLVLSCGRRLSQRLQTYRDLAQELHAKDRVHTYGSFTITEVLP